MNSQIIILVRAAALLLAGIISVQAQTPTTAISSNSARPGQPAPPPRSPAAAEALREAVYAVKQKIEAKFRSHATDFSRPTAEEFAPEQQALDALIAAHQGEKDEAIAELSFMKAALHLRIPGANQGELSKEAFNQVTQNYPGTYAAQEAAMVLKWSGSGTDDGTADDADETQARHRQQLVGQPLPDFQAKDLEGLALSPTRYHGKVLLVDIWGTECAPCMAEMPNVKKVYDQYHGQGFEVLGICVNSSPGSASYKTGLPAFLKTHNMPWPECDDRDRPDGPFYDPFFAYHGPMPSNFLIGKNGKVIGLDLFGKDLADAVAKAVAAK